MQIKHRNLFRITRFILLKLPPVFELFAKYRVPQKRLLIIKTDAIGDYILFRNFIEVVKTSVIFKDYQIDLVGNKVWQDIALQYDSGFINDFLFIKPDDLYEAPLQTFKLGLKLYKKNYQMVLQPSFSRTFITDALAGFAAAKQVIGFEGGTERISKKYKIKTDKFYTQKLPDPTGIDFEFERSKFFFSEVLKQPVKLDRPFINAETKRNSGVIISLGAGVAKRSWETEKFLGLIKLILKHTPHHVCLTGGADEIKTAAYLMKHLPAERVDDLTGKTTLTRLIDLTGNSALVIGNETGAIHIAAAAKTKVICILGGGHFGRFAPYPEAIEAAPICLYKKMDCYNCNWNCIYKTAENEPYPCISALSLEEVWDMARRFL